MTLFRPPSGKKLLGLKVSLDVIERLHINSQRTRFTKSAILEKALTKFFDEQDEADRLAHEQRIKERAAYIRQCEIDNVMP